MKNLITLILACTAQLSFGQYKNDCDSFYNRPDVPAIYGSKESDLIDFVMNELIPVIVKTDSLYPQKLSVSFKIDSSGNLADFEFFKINLSEKCKSDINKKCLTMHWLPARINNINVCSKYLLPISCINWQ